MRHRLCVILLYSLAVFSGIGEARPIGLQDTSTANNYYRIAEQFLKAYRFDSSLYYYEKASVIYHAEALKSQKRSVWLQYVRCQNQMGFSNWHLAKTERALVCLNAALETGISQLGRNSAEVATSYINLGNVYGDKANSLLSGLEYQAELR